MVGQWFCCGWWLDGVEGTHNLFLRVFVGGEQVDGLHMAKVNVMSEQEDEEQLAHVLLLLVAVQRLVALEFAPDIGQLLIDPLDLGLLALACGWLEKEGRASD